MHTVQHPPKLYPCLTLLSIGLFLVGTNAFVIAGLLPDIARTLHVPDTSVSYSITFYALVVAVAAPLISVALPRLSRTTLMATGLFFIALGTAFAAVAPNIELFTLGRIIAGIGGAAVVPSATAAAATLASPERRGRAISFVAVGFTAATALGAPLGTALGSLGGWQLPLLVVAGLALMLGLTMVISLRGIPLSPPASFRQRFAPLRDNRVTLTLLTTFFVFIGFNTVYIFSSVITRGATGGSGGRLALLLALYGITGTIGTLVSGRLTDRFGNRIVAIAFLTLHAVVLAVMLLTEHSYWASAVVFAVWGIASFGASLPIQHRLSAINPPTASLALSWYATAMYGGIAIAPVLGTVAVRLGDASLIPATGAASLVVAIIVFLTGYRTQRQTPTTTTLHPVSTGATPNKNVGETSP